MYGSICLSDVPKELFKKAENGKVYLGISVNERKEVGQYGDTHFISCAPKKEERKDGVNYIIGNLKTYNPQPSVPTYEQISAAPSADEYDLPF